MSIMSSDDLASKLSQRGIPESSRDKIISSIIKHLMGNVRSEEKGSTNNGETTIDVPSTVADADKDVQSALSNIDQLSSSHPLVQRVQQEAGIQDPQLATQYTEQTLYAMKEHANENPARMHSIFRGLRSKKEEAKDEGQNLNGSFLHDGYDTF